MCLVLISGAQTFYLIGQTLWAKSDINQIFAIQMPLQAKSL
jgi:hypothetical protein